MARTHVIPPIPPPPRQARSAEKRRRVFEAAVDAFVADGVEGARVEDIVRAAGVSWGTFFRYFPRKEDVLLELAASDYRELVRPAAERALAEGRPVCEVLRVLFAGVAVPVRPPYVHGAALREVMAQPTRFAELLGEGSEPIVAFVARVLEEGRRRGEVRADVDPLTLAAVLTPAVLFPIVQGAYGDHRALRELPDRVDAEAMLDRVLPVAWRAVAA